uniref:Origin recognition complex subunit 3 N-terminal domain-containing protein n=1 Tax=Hucho hucho TaxID=62062 RepID=A0A4W5PG41_9TELE
MCNPRMARVALCSRPVPKRERRGQLGFFRSWQRGHREQQTLLEKMKTDTEDELNRIILDSLLEFIRKSASTFQRGTDDWASGVNVPNHEMTFQSASDQLQQSVTPFVVSIQAKECAALKHLMQRVRETDGCLCQCTLKTRKSLSNTVPMQKAYFCWQQHPPI